MLSSSERIAGAEMVNRSEAALPASRALAARAASMLAIGASRRRGGQGGQARRACWNVSSQVTSGVSRVTWRMFQEMPSSSTSRIRLLSIVLARKATTSGSPSSPATTSTAARNSGHAERIDGGAGHGGGLAGGVGACAAGVAGARVDIDAIRPGRPPTIRGWAPSAFT